MRSIVHGFGIEVCTSWPLQATGVFDKFHSIEDVEITQSSKDGSIEQLLKVDNLLRAVIGLDRKEHKWPMSLSIDDNRFFISFVLANSFRFQVRSLWPDCCGKQTSPAGTLATILRHPKASQRVQTRVLHFRHSLSAHGWKLVLRCGIVFILTTVLLGFVTHDIGTRSLLAQSSTENAPLKVVIKPLVPFVIADADRYSGFSIDLWQEIAGRINRDYTYQFVETVNDQLSAVAAGEADVAITGISMTKEREEAVDFSLPYFNAGLQIMTSAATDRGLITPRTILASLVTSPEFVSLILSLLVVIVVMAHVIWLFERSRNPDFPAPYLRGIWEGIWYTVVTMVTVGYGDKTVRTIAGRVIAMAWMFASLFLVASFTANITSQLTLNRFYGSIRGSEDLPGKVIVTVEGSTAAQYLASQHLPYIGVQSIDDAYPVLESGRADAIVYDSPVLLYYANGAGLGQVQVVGALFEPQDYGIAFPTGSHDRELINQALLEIKEDGTYATIYSRWFEAPANN